MKKKIISLMREHPRPTALVAVAMLGGFIYLLVTNRVQEALHWVDSFLP